MKKENPHPEIVTMLTLHPSNLTEESWKKILDDELGALVTFVKSDQGYRYGAFCYIVEYWKETKPPQDIADCITYAQSYGCVWIMFDIDAEPNKDLPIHEFDW